MKLQQLTCAPQLHGRWKNEGANAAVKQSSVGRGGGEGIRGFAWSAPTFHQLTAPEKAKDAPAPRHESTASSPQPTPPSSRVGSFFYPKTRCISPSMSLSCSFILTSNSRIGSPHHDSDFIHLHPPIAHGRNAAVPHLLQLGQSTPGPDCAPTLNPPSTTSLARPQTPTSSPSTDQTGNRPTTSSAPSTASCIPTHHQDDQRGVRIDLPPVNVVWGANGPLAVGRAKR